MGGENSKHVQGYQQNGSPYYDSQGYAQGDSPNEPSNKGIFGRLSQAVGFGNSSTGGTGGQSPADMLTTGEGTQPLSDLTWKKKENKYLGISSISDKEAKEQKDLKQSKHVDQYLNKFPENEKYLGFENVSTIILPIYRQPSNICYANSAIQVLFHCIPFREQVLLWKPCNKEKNYLINELNELFKSMVSAKGNRGVINHKRFIGRIRAGNALFNNDEHHDSHEFISWLIDEIHMNIHEDYRFFVKKRLQSKDYQKDFQKFVNSHEGSNDSNPLFQFYTDKQNYAIANNQGPQKTLFDKIKDQGLEVPTANYSQMTKEELDKLIQTKVLSNFKTWVQQMFEGQLVSITKCQTCERRSTREETFMNLSVDIEKNTSLSHCLKKFSTKELLNMGDKFYCESCNTKQVATRQMMIKMRPKLLLIHLKRFKMNFQTMQHQKLSYRIPYPSILHIEDNQIYHGPANEDIEEEKSNAPSDPGEFRDLNLIDNVLLQSESHQGYFKIKSESDEKNHSYDLKGIVVHYGTGMHYGHYWSLARTSGLNQKWIEFDDFKVSVVEDKEIERYYGLPPEYQSSAGWNSAYLLLYESQELSSTSDNENQ